MSEIKIFRQDQQDSAELIPVRDRSVVVVEALVPSAYSKTGG
jgi:hypothetical protein